MHIIKQIGALAAKIEHVETGELRIDMVVGEVKAVERELLNEALNAIIGAVHDELHARGLL